mgnify:FL=1|tara:strand:- start:123 stop:479 length:357 start_codon:yes stop_codon:yes gene_type:complete
MKQITVLLSTISFIFFTACGGGKIEGTWKPDTSGMGEMQKELAKDMFFSFEKGGKGTMSALGMKVPIEWKVEGSELVWTMEMLGTKKEERSQFKVSGNTLTLITEENGKKKEAKFKRE